MQRLPQSGIARSVKHVFTICFLCLGFCAPLVSQGAQPASDPQVDNGVKSQGSYNSFADNVSLSSGNLSFCIPLVTLPGVNKHDLRIPLCYNSQVFEQSSTSGQAVATVSWFPWTWNSSVPVMGPGWTMTGRPGFFASNQSSQGLPVLFSSDGDRVSFPSSGFNHDYGPDGSMADIYGSTGNTSHEVVIFRNGTQVVGALSSPNNQEFDTNGTHINFSATGVTDTVGRSVTVSAPAGGNTSPTFSFTYPDPSGSGATTSVTVQFTVSTFTCAGAQSTEALSGPYAMPTKVVLPNGTSWSIEYGACGLVSKVTQPTGGYTRYDYTLHYFKQLSTQNASSYTSLGQYEISHRYVCPAAVGPGQSCPVSEQVTTYTPILNNTFNNSQMTVVDPVGNQVVYQFAQGNPNTFSGQAAVETSRIYSDSNGNVLETIQTQYANTTQQQSCPSLPSIQTTILNNGEQAQKVWTYDCYLTESLDTVLTKEQDYDFGPGSPGPLLRTMSYTWLQRDNPAVYGWPTSQYPNAVHILDRKTSETTMDGSGNLIAQTKYVTITPARRQAAPPGT